MGPILMVSGESKVISIPVELSNSLVSTDIVRLFSTLSAIPYSIEKEFTLRIGRVRESFESGSFKVFPWINNSMKPWIITSTDASDGIISARSGPIGDNASTKLAIRVLYDANDTFKFRYKISSEQGYDKLSFTVNNKEILKDNFSPFNSGEIQWTTIETPVTKGLNEFKWTYRKDTRDIGGDDCAWIDQIDFTSSGMIKYISRDLSLVSIPEPKVNKVGQGELKVKVQNTGIDTISNFNLSYTLNDEPSVSQHFNLNLIAGDTATVTFKSKMDLSRYGLYKATVFGHDNYDDYLNNDTLSINIENTKISESLSLYPNPFTDEFRLYINSRGNDEIKVSIYDINGSLVYESSESILKGGNTLIFNDFKLKPATYYLVIKGMSIQKSISIIKITR
ncbi:MAG TPA: T9SS type A sorting domain-containing protein [Bacteroidales bacterium]|nr:T9SS type A sorting domain-containing protein [Bacteroidales bacterium]